ncbi:MAG TPA: hypothetical protein VMS11_00040 [Solirubrobacterales bacterium]|nr:hypothetical protein [Solirubrobacterales bacterium]
MQIIKSGIWQAEVVSRVDELETRRKAAAAHKSKPKRAEEKKEILESVKASLATAKDVATKSWTFRLKAWWTGSQITQAWEAVHHAELALVGVERKRNVRATIPRLLAWIESAMNASKRRDHHEEVLTAQLKSKTDTTDPKKETVAKRPPLDRVAVRQALMDVIAANRLRYADLRAFRNLLIVVTALLALLVLVAAIWHGINPDFLTLCPKGKRCPPGPEGSSVAVIALLGAIGGSLALAFGLTEAATPPSRYDPKAWQTFLKPVTGAVTGLLGVLFVQAGFLVPPAGNKGYSLLVYAVLFGFSGQLLTQYVDKRAAGLMSPSSSKKAADEEGSDKEAKPT